MNYTVVYSDELSHHGILGMKWGVRRYQNEDGTLTDAGRRRYGKNYTIRDLKKNLEGAKTYEEKKSLMTSNKVNRMTRTKYMKAMTTAGTTVTGVASSATLGGLMAAGVLTVNPLIPIAALAGSVVTGKAINKGRDIANVFREMKVNRMEIKLDREKSSSTKSTTNFKSFKDTQERDDAGHAEAKKYGMDQGDNFKVFGNALAGDPDSIKIVEEWKKKEDK